ncbi:fetuin-B-like [Pseudophryne corroboree]|uniref:fetuin-B-like n=1 Tax=Pseudophryne corroboree TaxID=495146 RepID=UPI0030814F28
MKMEPVYVLALCVLVSLCSATSPPPPPKLTPLNCNETQLQTEIAADLINERRDEGFVLRPFRINSAYQRESSKIPDGNIYYIDFSVIETDCSVVSGKTWKECSIDIPFHEQAIGDCKAIIAISRPWRILKLLKYDCTVTPVPSSTIHRLCPDCPTVITDITAEIKAKADRLVEKFNKESNETSHFKVDHIDRVRSQWVVGPSYFFYFTIKETGCSKAQADVILENCNDLRDNETHVGFCKGSIYTSTLENVETLEVSCEIYEPKDDDNEHGHCDHGKESSTSEQGKEKPDGKRPGKAGRDNYAPGVRGPEFRGHKHHRCHPHHHKHDHRHHSHHHHHHHHDLNQTHHHDHSHDHHKHHGHHNHTAAEGHGSSSEEQSDKRSFVKKSKGSSRYYYNTDDSQIAPSPGVPRPPHGRGPHRKSIRDKFDFPKEVSPLQTCPGQPLVDLPQVLKDILTV